MKKTLLLFTAAMFLHTACHRERLTQQIDLDGSWYVDHIIDKTTGHSEPGLFPADTVVIYFLNDSVCQGSTHRNLFTTVYSYNGDSLINFKWPVFTLMPEDTLGERFLKLMRTCPMNSYPCPNWASHIELVNQILIIDSKDRYKAILKKL